ncbi:MAG: hypothetical protein ACK5KL_10185 [Dysgonomonas sp.]
MNKEYIIPSKEDPIFRAYCSDFGYIEHDFYKHWEVKTDEHWVIGSTFAIDLTDAIVRLHEFIKSYEYSNSKTKYKIVMFCGELDKYGDSKETKVYSITQSNAKKYRLI